jgi:hypothetical protein
MNRLVMLSLVAASSLLTIASCQRDEDTIREALSAREASWKSNVDTLKAEKEAFRRRLSGAAGAGPARVRVGATIDGLGQSIADVEAQMRQVRPRVERTLTRGGDAAQKVLDDETGRMNEYLQHLATDLTAAGRELDALGRTEVESAQAE